MMVFANLIVITIILVITIIMIMRPLPLLLIFTDKILLFTHFPVFLGAT